MKQLKMIKYTHGAFILAVVLQISTSFADAKPHLHQHSLTGSSSVAGLPVIELDKLEPGPIPLVYASPNQKTATQSATEHGETFTQSIALENQPSKDKRPPVKPAQQKQEGSPQSESSNQKPGKKADDVQKDAVKSRQASEADLDRWAKAITMGATLGLLFAVAMFVSNHLQQQPRADLATTGAIVTGAVVVAAVASGIAYVVADPKHGARAGQGEHEPRQWVVLKSDAFHFDICMPQQVDYKRKQVHELWKNTLRHEEDSRDFMEMSYEYDEESIHGQPDKQAEARYYQQKYVYDPGLSATKAARRWIDLFQGKINSNRELEVGGAAVGREIEGTISDGWSFHVVSYTTGAGQSYVAVVSGSTAFVSSPDAKRFLSSLHFKKS